MILTTSQIQCRKVTRVAYFGSTDYLCIQLAQHIFPEGLGKRDFAYQIEHSAKLGNQLRHSFDAVTLICMLSLPNFGVAD